MNETNIIGMLEAHLKAEDDNIARIEAQLQLAQDRKLLIQQEIKQVIEDGRERVMTYGSWLAKDVANSDAYDAAAPCERHEWEWHFGLYDSQVYASCKNCGQAGPSRKA